MDSKLKPDIKQLKYDIKWYTFPTFPFVKIDSSAPLAWFCFIRSCTKLKESVLKCHKVMSGFK